MTDYTTLPQVKRYIDTDKNTDDTVLSEMITRASKAIDTFTSRTFSARTETRVFDAVRDTDGLTLFVDDDLLTVTTLVNGDGVTLTNSDFVLRPANVQPKYAIKLLASAGTAWDFVSDPEDAISVAGTWGYNVGSTAPEDIRHAANRLTAWYYAQRDAPFGVIGLPELGEADVSTAIPPDIQSILIPYKRMTVKAV